jgi:hypothetical protein
MVLIREETIEEGMKTWTCVKLYLSIHPSIYNNIYIYILMYNLIVHLL